MSALSALAAQEAVVPGSVPTPFGLPPFEPFRKIPRLSRDCIITEKIDGTNALVYVGEDGRVAAGSRSRWLIDGVDNFGFAAWVKANEAELQRLGPGFHYGEWYGLGIQRRYGLDHRRFALFNASLWGPGGKREFDRPRCCDVVPVISRRTFDTSVVEGALDLLRTGGSFAVPGFMKPEGVVIYHAASGQLFKKLLENDAQAKGEQP